MADEAQNNKKKKNTHVGAMTFLGFIVVFVVLFACFMMGGSTASEIVHEAEFWLFWLVICALIVFYVFVTWLERKLNPSPKAAPAATEENPEPEGEGKNM